MQVKYEMLRRVSVENASVTDATAEYGVSRPTYYQAKASFDEAGIAGLVPKKRGPRGPHKLQGEVLAFLEKQLVPGEPIRARELARGDPTGVLGRRASADDRARARWKKNSAMSAGADAAGSAGGGETSPSSTRRCARPLSAKRSRSRRGAGSCSFFVEACGDGRRRRPPRARLPRADALSSSRHRPSMRSSEPSFTSSPRWR